MLVRIDEDTAIEMLMDRVHFWTDDDIVCELYHKMYENYVYNGCFDGGEFDIMKIVDNDYVNYCDVISKCDESYEDIKKLFDANGLDDISCEYELNHGYNFIEAEYSGSFLCRI